MIQHLFSRYGAIDDIDLEENAVNMMGLYDPVESLARLIDQLKKGREFARSGGQTISNAMMMSKCITILEQTGVFNDSIREWRQSSADLKTWAKYKFFFHRVHREEKISEQAQEKGGTPPRCKTSTVHHLPLQKRTMRR